MWIIIQIFYSGILPLADPPPSNHISNISISGQTQPHRPKLAYMTLETFRIARFIITQNNSGVDGLCSDQAGIGLYYN